MNVISTGDQHGSPYVLLTFLHDLHDTLQMGNSQWLLGTFYNIRFIRCIEHCHFRCHMARRHY